MSYDGTNFTSAGIPLSNSVGPDSVVSTTFSLMFDTGAKTISLTESGDDGSVLNGTIISSIVPSFGATTEVTFHVRWDTLPGDFGSFLGTPTGLDDTQVTVTGDLSLGTLPTSGTVTGVTLDILPTPEPMSLALLGSGLIMIGGAIRRRMRE